MPTFEDIAVYTKEFNLNEALNDIFQAQNIQTWVLETIVRRIDTTGITGSEQSLKTDKAKGGEVYSDVTIDIKEWFGGVTSHVTLKDSGTFHESFRFALNLFGFEIEADFNKSDGNIAKNFTNMYGSSAEFEDDVMSLTKFEIDEMLKNKINPLILKEYHETVYRP